MIEAFVTIALLHWVVLLAPGVNFVLMLQLGAGSSRSAAIAAVAGITTATMIWAVLAVLGVGALFTAHPALRQIAQVAGGLYLCYVAYKMWNSSGAAQITDRQPLTALAAYRIGLITNMLNPKPALFFGSVFVTAMPPEPSLTIQVLAVLLVYANSIIWHLFLALAFSAPWVQRAFNQFFAVFNRIAAVLVGAFGAKLLVNVAQEHRAGQ